MIQVNIALEIFALAITTLLLFCCVLELVRKKDTGTVLFTAMLGVNAVVLVSDIVTWVFAGREDLTTPLYVANFLVYSLGYVLTALYTAYIVHYIRRKAKVWTPVVPVIAALCGIAVLLVALSLYNHMYFSFTDGIYVRGPLYWLSQVYPIALIVINIVIILLHEKSLGLHDTCAMLSYCLLPVIAMIIQLRVYGITLLYIATTLSLMIVYVMVHIEQGRRLEVQTRELTQANVAIMLSQIQPHFLYNSLSVIKELCRSDPALAEQVVMDFSNYLRGNLDSLSSKKPVLFTDELEHTRTFLELERLQYGDMLEVVYDIRETAFLLPTLSLQPLAENAVKYGMKERDRLTVTISSFREGEDYIVTVADDGAGFDPAAPLSPDRSHVGIANVKERLALQSNGRLEIESVKGHGTTVRLVIPSDRGTS